MKSEPWRGDLATRCLHLETKIQHQKIELARLNREPRYTIAEIRRACSFCEGEGHIPRGEESDECEACGRLVRNLESAE